MDYNQKKELVAGLKKELLGMDTPLFGRMCEDGRYVADRIAFEMFTDEEREIAKRHNEIFENEIRTAILEKREQEYIEKRMKDAWKDRNAMRNGYHSDPFGHLDILPRLKSWDSLD